MVIKFKFNLGDDVITLFGEEGVIKDMIGSETTNKVKPLVTSDNRCLIRTSTSSRWVNEGTLKLFNEKDKGMKIEFKFNVDERVTTPFKEEGIVEMLGFDDGGIKYYITTPTNSNWFRENTLESIETKNNGEYTGYNS